MWDLAYIVQYGDMLPDTSLKNIELSLLSCTKNEGELIKAIVYCLFYLIK